MSDASTCLHCGYDHYPHEIDAHNCENVLREKLAAMTAERDTLKDICCKWTQNDDGAWETSCKNTFEITEGTPKENNMKFCCYCAGAIEGKP